MSASSSDTSPPASLMSTAVMVPQYTLSEAYLRVMNNRYGQAMGVQYSNDPPSGPRSTPTVHDSRCKSNRRIRDLLDHENLPRSYDLKVRQLKRKLRARSLQVSGVKSVLIERLQRWDAQQPPKIILTHAAVDDLPLLKLPLEIRQQIYGHALKLRPQVHGYIQGHANTAILRVSSQVYHEALPILHSVNRICIEIFGDYHIRFGRRGQYLSTRVLPRKHAWNSRPSKRPWDHLPLFFQSCENLEIHFASSYDGGSNLISQKMLDVMVIQARSLVNVVLPSYSQLRRLRIIFEIHEEIKHILERTTTIGVSDAAIKEYETMTVMAFGQLRGLVKVEFEGLIHANAAFVQQVRLAMMQPRPVGLRNLSKFSPAANIYSHVLIVFAGHWSTLQGQSSSTGTNSTTTQGG